MQLDGVTTVTERALDEEALTAQCREVTALAMQHLTDMRIREGAHLRDDLQVHLDAAAALDPFVQTYVGILERELARDRTAGASAD